MATNAFLFKYSHLLDIGQLEQAKQLLASEIELKVDRYQNTKFSSTLSLEQNRSSRLSKQSVETILDGCTVQLRSLIAERFENSRLPKSQKILVIGDYWAFNPFLEMDIWTGLSNIQGISVGYSSPHFLDFESIRAIEQVVGNLVRRRPDHIVISYGGGALFSKRKQNISTRNLNRLNDRALEVFKNLDRLTFKLARDLPKARFWIHGYAAFCEAQKQEVAKYNELLQEHLSASTRRFYVDLQSCRRGKVQNCDKLFCPDPHFIQQVAETFANKFLARPAS